MLKTQKSGKITKRLSYLEIAMALSKGKATTIIFVKPNGKTVRQAIQPTFLKDYKGRKKRLTQLIDDLHSIKHDMECKYFRL